MNPKFARPRAQKLNSKYITKFTNISFSRAKKNEKPINWTCGHLTCGLWIVKAKMFHSAILPRLHKMGSSGTAKGVFTYKFLMGKCKWEKLPYTAKKPTHPKVLWVLLDLWGYQSFV